ncbi:MAG: hypothetical protein IKQ87_05740, partial [Clostridia bacterium]|nr:hypothetical protein [Clostridia bacterium]
EGGSGALLSAVRAGQQINGRKLRRAFSDLFLSFSKEIASTPPASAAAQTKCASVLRGLAQ